MTATDALDLAIEAMKRLHRELVTSDQVQDSDQLQRIDDISAAIRTLERLQRVIAVGE